MTTRVRTDLHEFRVAAAELPVSAAVGSELDGAVAVVRGDGQWWTTASDAIAGGAAAILVARPADAPVEALDALSAVAGGIPVIVERPLLRADVVALVGGLTEDVAPGALVVECHAPARSFSRAVRDATGWARAATGESLAYSAGWSGGGRALALLESRSGAAVSVVAATQPGAPPLGRLRITTIGRTRVEIDADIASVVAVTDAAGRRTAPAQFEGSARVALRRAIAAVHAGERVTDLADLRHDTLLAAAMLSSDKA